MDLPWVLQKLTSLQSSRQLLKYEALLLDYAPDFEMFFLRNLQNSLVDLSVAGQDQKVHVVSVICTSSLCNSSNPFLYNYLQSFGTSTLKLYASPAWNFHQTALWLLWQVGKGPGICTERYDYKSLKDAK